MDLSFKSSNSYEFIRKIGVGGLADVYLYLRKTAGLPDQQVALKVLRNNRPESILELINEAEKLKQVKHPCILSILGFEKTEQNQLALVLEYVDGCNLKEALQSNSLKYSEREQLALYVAKQMLSALSAAHNQNIIHGDISSRNILIAKNGELKLTDFGLSIGGNEKTKLNKGSVDYFDLNRWQGGLPCKQSDLFALGIVIYEVLCGANPLLATSIQKIQKNLTSFLKTQPWLSLNSFWKCFFNFLLAQRGEMPAFPFLADEYPKKLLSRHIINQAPLEFVISKTKTIVLSRLQRFKISILGQVALMFFATLMLFAPVATSNDSLEAKFKRTCLITITSRVWGEIFINHKSIGYTPIVNLPLKQGYYSFVWRGNNGVEIKRSIRAFNSGVLYLQIK